MHCKNKAMTNRVEKLKLLRTYNATKNSFGAGVWRDDSGRLRRYTCNSKSLRQSLNRKIRRKLKQVVDYEESSPSVGHYRRMEDYWWDLL